MHRVYRTGRMGNTGKAISFFNKNSKGISKGLIDILEEANQKIPNFLYVEIENLGKKLLNKVERHSYKENKRIYKDEKTKNIKSSERKKVSASEKTTSIDVANSKPQNISVA